MVLIIFRIFLFADALLADLQNSTNPSTISSSTPGYGSVNARTKHSPGGVTEIPITRSDSYSMKSVSNFSLINSVPR